MSMKFQLLIKTKIPTNEEVSCFKSLRCCFILLINVKMPINIYELDNFVLSSVEHEKVLYLRGQVILKQAYLATETS